MKADWTIEVRDGDGEIILTGLVSDLLEAGILKALVFDFSDNKLAALSLWSPLSPSGENEEWSEVASKHDTEEE